MIFRVLTYNIHRAIGVDRRFRPSRIVEIIAHHDPDLALLQEVDEGAPRSRELNLARELADALGYPYFAVGLNVRLRKGKYGNATLSRYPILRERNIDLTVGSRRARGCQHTTVRLEEPGGRHRELEVFNLHLGLTSKERMHQIGLLVRSREFASLPASRVCIVGGDFNDWRNGLGPLFTEILEFRCATDHVSRRAHPLRTYPSFSPTGPLDRIFFRGPLRTVATRRCRLRIAKVASDHLPVGVDFELR